jgi:hypothetical protein
MNIIFKKEVILFLIFISLLQSCYNPKYFEKKKSLCYEFHEYLIVDQLILYPDKTFGYWVVGDLIDAKSEGNWVVDNGYIILNSFDKYKSGYIIDVIESFNDTINGYYIQVYTESEALFPGYLIFDNQPTKGVVNLNDKGIGLWEGIINDKMTITYFGETYSYNVKNRNANFFTFIIKPKDLRLYYMENQKWKIKSNKKLLYKNEFIYKLEKCD